MSKDLHSLQTGREESQLHWSLSREKTILLSTNMKKSDVAGISTTTLSPSLQMH